MRKWTVIIENDHKPNEKLKVVNISERYLRNVGIITVAFMIFSFSVFITAKMNQLDPNAKYNLQARKNLLMSSLSNKNVYLDNLIVKLEKYVELEKKMRIFANLVPIPEDVRKLGIGGYEIFDRRIENIDGRAKKVVSNLDKRLFQVKNIINFQSSNVSEIKGNVNEHYTLLKHTPSVIPTEGKITSPFSERRNPITGRREFHHALDIANDHNTPVYSPANGKVVFIGFLPGYGKTIRIDHGYGYITLYAHLNKILVKEGDYVNRHDKIALMGSSGNSTGPHLHYEVKIFNKKVDPQIYICEDTLIR